MATNIFSAFVRYSVVGHYAVQIAKYLGAYVIGISSAKNKNFVLGLGADEHIAYDEQRFGDDRSQMAVQFTHRTNRCGGASAKYHSQHRAI